MRPSGKPSLDAKWVCQCSCGKTKEIRGHNLLSGRSTSCGCLRTSQLTARLTKHGQSHTPEYGAWAAMVGRCHNENHSNYKNYGAKGIHVAQEFRDYAVFRAYVLNNLGQRKPGDTLDRIDSKMGYAPGNIRWASPKQQARNLRNNRIVEYKGREMCLAEAVELSGLPYYTVHGRLRRGWTEQEALSTPVGIARRSKTMTALSARRSHHEKRPVA